MQYTVYSIHRLSIQSTVYLLVAFPNFCSVTIPFSHFFMVCLYRISVDFRLVLALSRIALLAGYLSLFVIPPFLFVLDDFIFLKRIPMFVRLYSLFRSLARHDSGWFSNLVSCKHIPHL